MVDAFSVHIKNDTARAQPFHLYYILSQDLVNNSCPTHNWFVEVVHKASNVTTDHILYTLNLPPYSQPLLLEQ